MNDTNLVLGGKEFSSRLIVGTGKYSSMDVMKEAHEASGAQIITVALRRVSLPSGESLLEHLDTTRYTLLPNTAGCYTADEAVRTAYLAREAGLGEMIKLEGIGDSRTLFPDVEGLLEATRELARDGFTVMPYTNDDPVIARKLEEAGAACVMPLAAPIGSGLGIRNPYNIKIILESVSVPVIVDAGVGTASDAAIAMELGCEGVLMNTAIAGARDPVAMARAMRLAIQAPRAPLVVNDRVDVALAVGADAVQRTSTSLRIEDIRAIADKRLRVGASVHSLPDALEAEVEGADWLVFGPVYDTPSKRMYGPPQGLEKLARVAAAVRLPVVAIGGITPARVRDVRAAGARGVAVVSSILAADSPADATRRFLGALAAS